MARTLQGLSSAKDLANKQQEDPTWSGVITKIRNGNQDGEEHSKQMFLDENGVLVRVVGDDVRERRQVCIAEQDHEEQLRRAHDGLSGTHSGIPRTLESLRIDCYWPGMEADVGRYVKSCWACQQNKLWIPKKQGLMTEFQDDAQFEPWTTIHIDNVTRLPKTS